MLEEFFQTNLVILLFAHGLVFFLMGFAVLLQSRHSSELTLARSLPLLGCFGILQALADWGVFFIPIQAGYLGAGIVRFLEAVDITFLAFSFLTLGLFGARLWVDSHDQQHWLVWVPVTVFAIWFVNFLLYPFVWAGAGYQAWMQAADLWARYMLGLLGTTLAGVGLYAQQVEFRRPGMEKLLYQLEWLIFSIVLFGISAALVGLNEETFSLSVLGVKDTAFAVLHPPAFLLRGVSGLLMMIFSVRLLDVFEIENRRRLEEARHVQMVLDERDRIARELHDGTMQSLYAVGLRLESSVCMADEIPEEVRAETRDILTALRNAVAEMRKYVMDLKGSLAHQPLHQRLGSVVSEVQQNSDVPIDFKATSIQVGEFDDAEANHICQIVHEALSNALRHGHPKHISVALTRVLGGVQVTVRDDGAGFQVQERLEPEHHGLSNMRQRARVLGGELKVQSAPGAGTAIYLKVPAKGGLM